MHSRRPSITVIACTTFKFNDYRIGRSRCTKKSIPNQRRKCLPRKDESTIFGDDLSLTLPELIKIPDILFMGFPESAEVLDHFRPTVISQRIPLTKRKSRLSILPRSVAKSRGCSGLFGTLGRFERSPSSSWLPGRSRKAFPRCSSRATFSRGRGSRTLRSQSSIFGE